MNPAPPTSAPATLPPGSEEGRRRGGQDLSAHAYQEVRRAIINLSFQPGHQLKETVLAQWLGTSRTPVREALKRLQGEGLIRGLSSGGAVVSEVSVEDVENAYLMIEIVEGLASRLAAARYTDDEGPGLRQSIDELEQAATAADLDRWTAVDAAFHDQIRVLARNALLDRVAHMVYPTIERVRSMYLREGHEPDRLAVAMAAHRELGETILARDEPGAEALARALFRRSHEDNVRLLRQWVVPLRRSF